MRRLLPRPVPLVEHLQLLFGPAQVGFRLRQAIFGELAALPGLGLACLGVEIVQVGKEPARHEGSEHPIVCVHIELDDVRLPVHAGRNELRELFDALVQAVGRIVAALVQDLEQRGGVPRDAFLGGTRITGAEHPFHQLPAFDEVGVKLRRLARLPTQGDPELARKPSEARRHAGVCAYFWDKRGDGGIRRRDE